MGQTVAIAVACAALLVVVAEIFLPGPNDNTLADVQTWATATSARVEQFASFETRTSERLAAVENSLDLIRLKTDAKLSKIVGERVIDLPEDGGTYWTTLYYKDQYNDASSRRLAGFMASDPRLLSLASMTRVNVYQPGNKMYDYRYANLIGGPNGAGLPAIVVQDPKGVLVYKASGLNLPNSASQLADEISAAISNTGSTGALSTPAAETSVVTAASFKPCPKPVPTPAPTPAPTPVPDFRPAEHPPAEQGVSIIVAVGAMIAATAFGVWRQWKSP